MTASELRYRRTRGGAMVHRADCRYAKNGVAWHYADVFTADDICLVMASAPWLNACRVCRPERAS